MDQRKAGPTAPALGLALAALVLSPACRHDWALPVAEGGPADLGPVPKCWAVLGGGSATDAGRAIAVDDAGMIYIAGDFQGSAAFGGFKLEGRGSEDVFVAKLDPHGRYLWAKGFTGKGTSSARAIAIDGKGIYVAGTFQERVALGPYTLDAGGSTDNAFVARLDPADGSVVWARQATGESTGLALAAGEQHVHLLGSYQGELRFGAATASPPAGGSDIFVAKLEKGNGAPGWARRLGGGLDNDPNLPHSLHGLAVDRTGSIYVATHLACKDTGGNPTATFGPSDNHTASAAFQGGGDGYVVKLDSAGNVTWVTAVGGASWDEATGVAVDDSGAPYVVGHFGRTVLFPRQPSGAFKLTSTGDTDTFVGKLDGSTGRFVWVRNGGGRRRESYNRVAVGPPSRLFVSGNYQSDASFGSHDLPSFGPTDTYLTALDAQGTFLWAEGSRGVGSEVPKDLAADAQGTLYTVGGVVDLGVFCGQPAPAKGTDVFVWRFSKE